MDEFQKCPNTLVADLGDAVSTLFDPFNVKYYAQVTNLSVERSVIPEAWAKQVDDELKNNVDISPVSEFASFYLSNLVIPCRVQCNDIYWP